MNHLRRPRLRSLTSRLLPRRPDAELALFFIPGPGLDSTANGDHGGIQKIEGNLAEEFWLVC